MATDKTQGLPHEAAATAAEIAAAAIAPFVQNRLASLLRSRDLMVKVVMVSLLVSPRRCGWHVRNIGSYCLYVKHYFNRSSPLALASSPCIPWRSPVDHRWYTGAVPDQPPAPRLPQALCAQSASACIRGCSRSSGYCTLSKHVVVALLRGADCAAFHWSFSTRMCRPLASSRGVRPPPGALRYCRPVRWSVCKRIPDLIS